ncbi:MAG: UbiA family prenyltransferase [Nitrosopumilus sp.]|nr:UbiA family prenyltransferase [Nitrosopumilus sp.]
MVRTYLQLIRFPGIFTVLSNVLLGFFVVQQVAFDWLYLGLLLATSGCLFFAGMVFNDFFDFPLDKKQRPERPLPSGRISKNNAFYLGLCFLVLANICSALVGFQTLLVSLLMTGFILLYDIKLKNIPVMSILNLSLIRFFNVILGTTIVALSIEVILIAIPVAILVAGISIFAKTEDSQYSKRAEILNLIFIIATVFYVNLLAFGGEIIFYAFIGIFIFIIFVPFYFYKDKTNTNIQKKVTFQLLSIIILDATLLSIYSELIFAIITLILFVPAYFITRRMYLT